MPRIIKKENGKYKAVVNMGKDPSTGKRKRKAKTFKRKLDAQSWVADMIKEREQGFAIDPQDFSVKTYLLYWLKNYAEHQTKGTTYDGYTFIINSHFIPALGAIKLEDLLPVHIQTYFSKKRVKGRLDGKPGGLAGETLKKHYRVLNESMNQAIKWQILKYNPCSAVDCPRPDDSSKKVVAISKKQLDKLIDTAKITDSWTHTFIYVAAYTGMRRSELMGLKWDNVDFENKAIRVKTVLVTNRKKGKSKDGSNLRNTTKSKTSTRSIKITDRVVQVLKQHKKEQLENQLLLGNPKDYNKLNLVFCKVDGTKYYPDRANIKFNKVRDKAKLPKELTPHVLRHTHATLLLKAGVNPKIVQERLGHASIAETMDTYSHVIPTMQEETANKFDEIMN